MSIKMNVVSPQGPRLTHTTKYLSIEYPDTREGKQALLIELESELCTLRNVLRRESNEVRRSQGYQATGNTWNAFLHLVAELWTEHEMLKHEGHLGLIKKYRRSKDYARKRWDVLNKDSCFMKEFNTWCSHFEKAKVTCPRNERGLKNLCQTFYKKHLRYIIDDSDAHIEPELTVGRPDSESSTTQHAVFLSPTPQASGHNASMPLLQTLQPGQGVDDELDSDFICDWDLQLFESECTWDIIAGFPDGFNGNGTSTKKQKLN